jgi:hypothetical protein
MGHEIFAVHQFFCRNLGGPRPTRPAHCARPFLLLQERTQRQPSTPLSLYKAPDHPSGRSFPGRVGAAADGVHNAFQEVPGLGQEARSLLEQWPRHPTMISHNVVGLAAALLLHANFHIASRLTQGSMYHGIRGKLSGLKFHNSLQQRFATIPMSPILMCACLHISLVLLPYSCVLPI